MMKDRGKLNRPKWVMGQLRRVRFDGEEAVDERESKIVCKGVCF